VVPPSGSVCGLAATVSGCAAPTAIHVPEKDCARVKTQPVTLARVLVVLRNEGFKSRARGFCRANAPSLAYEITNGPTDPVGYERTQSEVGIVDCSLYKRRVFSAHLKTELREPAYSPLFHGRKAHFWFRNVECVLYAGDKLQDRQVAHLAAAMHELTAS
jgi:hypothetical protein